MDSGLAIDTPLDLPNGIVAEITIGLKNIIMFVLPISGSDEAPLQYATRPHIEERLARLEKSWWEYIPDVLAMEINEEEGDDDEVDAWAMGRMRITIF